MFIQRNPANRKGNQVHIEVTNMPYRSNQCIDGIEVTAISDEGSEAPGSQYKYCIGISFQDIGRIIDLISDEMSDEEIREAFSCRVEKLDHLRSIAMGYCKVK